VVPRSSFLLRCPYSHVYALWILRQLHAAEFFFVEKLIVAHPLNISSFSVEPEYSFKGGSLQEPAPGPSLNEINPYPPSLFI
jgi:hypothetical protein